MPSIHRVDLRNFHIESSFFLSAARQCRNPLVFLDTEFPGNIYRSTKHYTQLSLDERYSLLKLNTNVMRPIQIGITLSDGVSFTNTWQFDLRDFDLRCHPHSLDSIALLESSGIDLKCNSQIGIPLIWVAQLLPNAGLVGLCSNAIWVAFHGCYDFAFLVKALLKLMTRMSMMLPKTLETFMGLTRSLFGGYIYDVKCIMKNCNGLYGGLEQVAKKLNVKRVMGKAHQAGSDSLLTCHVFLRMKNVFFSHANDGEEEMPYEGVIFGING